jgi:photosystem II stability/assembly factor-like uncharacterized protein
MNSRFRPLLLCCWLALAATFPRANAQWLTQAFTLKPGWNAIHLHVNATNDTLDNLVGALSPISEIWLWQPNSVEGRIVSSPIPLSGSDWVQWTKATGPAEAFPLRANATYLVRNSGSSDYVWNLKGKPVPPSVSWTASGLNFIGLPIRADSSPSFYNFLLPTKALTEFTIFDYPGGEAVGAPPNTVSLFSVNSETVKRGKAYWIRRSSGENRYFGPFETVLQSQSGVGFGDSYGSYSFRLRNQLEVSNNVVVTLLASETSPAGETLPVPPLLLRTSLDSVTLKYGFAEILAGQGHNFALAPKGRPGSEVEVVLGLDRSTMGGTNGAPFAAILRLQDTTLGQLQVDLPVTATKSSTEGLWVGEASITQVGNYLKTYAKATNAVDFTNRLAELNLLNDGLKTVVLPAGDWTPHALSFTTPAIAADQDWVSVASSADGTNLVAAAAGGRLYTSADAGANWVFRDLDRAWVSVASSADGTNLVAAVAGGQLYVSPDAGGTWSSTESDRAWTAVASSADGTNLVAAVAGGRLYTSADAGGTWAPRDVARSWVSVASSADGQKLFAAVQGGQLFASTNAGVNWMPLLGAAGTNWQAVATSADGKMVVAVENPGAIYASTDGGVTWDLKASAPPAAQWRAVASSTNGNALVAVASGGRIYTSADAGKSWTARESTRDWTAVASSADGTHLVAGETGGASQLYTIKGTLSTPTLTYDPGSNLILSGGGKFLTAAFDTELGAVPAPFPLRLIVHQDANGISRLLQRVYLGPGLAGTNMIITLQESQLNPAALAQARRLSAVHLPLSGAPWVFQGAFGGVGILNAVLTEGFANTASNPFLHAYHPDHDNLDTLFQPITKPGAEAYDIKRQITLSFTPPGNDFNSRTAGSSRMQGTYLENIVLKGGNNQARTVVTKGSFLLNRVSSIATLQ